MSINDNIKFLENTKQGFRKAISWNKHGSEITTQRKKKLDYPIDPTFRKINCSFKNGDDDPTGGFFYEYYMPLVEIKDFNALIDNKPFFDRAVKNKQGAYEELVEMSRKMMTQQEIYYIIYIIKIIINLLA